MTDFVEIITRRVANLYHDIPFHLPSCYFGVCTSKFNCLCILTFN